MASTAWSLLMLVLVLALIPMVLWVLKKLQTLRLPGGERLLEVAAQLSLGARERVVVVRMRDRLLVLGVTPQQVTLLCEGTAADLAPAVPPTPMPDFAGLLRGLLPGAIGRQR